jgi:hypothetical protein
MCAALQLYTTTPLVCTHKIFTLFAFINYVYHLDLHFLYSFFLKLDILDLSRFIYIYN